MCNKTLPCETHRCKRICHRGECLPEGGCQQPCTLPRPDCSHPCAAPCHKGSSCPRTTCTAKVQSSATENSWTSSGSKTGYRVCTDVLCHIRAWVFQHIFPPSKVPPLSNNLFPSCKCLVNKFSVTSAQ